MRQYVTRALLSFFALGFISPVLAVDRCGDNSSNPGFDNLAMWHAYYVLRWAQQCKGQSFAVSAAESQVIDFNVALANNPSGTNLGTAWPPQGTADYEARRQWVNAPTFYIPDSATEHWLGPWQLDMNRFENRDCSIRVPPQFTNMRWCKSGCWAGDQQVLFIEKSDHLVGQSVWKRMDLAVDKEKFAVNLSSEATLEKLIYGVSAIDYFIKDPKPIQQFLLHFKMQSGGEIKVTKSHPLVDSDGKMRRASSLKAGEKLVLQDGTFDPIVSVISQPFYGKVYNFDVKNDKASEKIVIANGYLNGTHYFQDLGQSLLDRALVKSKLAAEFEK